MQQINYRCLCRFFQYVSRHIYGVVMFTVLFHWHRSKSPILFVPDSKLYGGPEVSRIGAGVGWAGTRGVSFFSIGPRGVMGGNSRDVGEVGSVFL